MTNTMRAGVLYKPHDLRIEEVSMPECGDDDLLIRVIYNGLCGTDSTEYAKAASMVPLTAAHPGSGHVGPTILGHEFIGEVVDAGSHVREFMGKRVACGAGVSCGKCARCLEGRTNLCDSYYTLGLSTHGGLAEYVVAPAKICLEIPDGCSDEDAALAQPLAVGMHSVHRANIKAGQTVALLGVGAIGSFICASLIGSGAVVTAMDIDESRLEVAKRLGAAETHLLARSETPASLREAFPQGFDVVFEASGVDGSAERAYSLAVLGGTVVLVGLNNKPQELVLSGAVLSEINTITTVAHVCATDLPAALDLLARHPLADILVDRIVNLENVAEEGLERLAAGQATGKILVDPRTAHSHK
jgi:(R,R)-butanediol dehydrogenase/meso-butanediol dehydrogenase/diacetyl reductase